MRAICYHFAWHILILENFPLTFRQRLLRSSDPAQNSISWIPVDSLEIVYKETHCQRICSKLFIIVSAVARRRTNLFKLTFKPLTDSARLSHRIISTLPRFLWFICYHWVICTQRRSVVLSNPSTISVHQHRLFEHNTFCDVGSNTVNSVRSETLPWITCFESMHSLRNNILISGTVTLPLCNLSVPCCAYMPKWARSSCFMFQITPCSQLDPQAITSIKMQML